MNTKLLSLTILSFLCSLAIGQTWQQKANFSGPARIIGETFSIHGKGYLAFGENVDSNIFYNDIWEYNPLNDTWSAKASAPFSARSSGIVLNNDSCVLIGLGWNRSTTFKDLYRYTPSTEMWDTLTSYPGNGGRSTFYATYKNKAYVGGGSTGTSTPYHSDFWEYDIANDTWTARGNIPLQNRIGGICSTIDSLVYMGLGHNGSSDFTDLWAYNTTTNLWAQKASFPGLGRLGANFFVLKGKLIVGGGHRFGSNWQGTQNDYYEYDPNTDSWAIIPNNFTSPNRTFSSAFVINDSAYIYGGVTNYPNVRNDVWVYKDQTVSIAETGINVEEGLKIYPNPNSGELFLTSNNEILDGLFTIFNQSGQLVFEKQFNQEPTPVRIDISGFESAFYFYKLIEQNGQSNSGTLIKVN